MIKFLKRNVRPAAILVVTFVAWFPAKSVFAALPHQEESAFAKRMMTLDRNKDGFLTSDELPKAVLQQIAGADLNKDGKWTSVELSSVSQKPREVQTQLSGEANGRGAGGRGRNRSGKGLAGRGPGRPNTGLGSPLDTAQILKFALTFDLDRDGGLNKEELNRYASALAGRRARARQLRESENAGMSRQPGEQKNGQGIPKAEDRDAGGPAKEASGLKSKADGTSSDPFGSGSGK